MEITKHIETAHLELFEETGVNVKLTQFKTYDAIDMILVIEQFQLYLLDISTYPCFCRGDALNAKWFSVTHSIAFDHALILKDILSYISQS